MGPPSQQIPKTKGNLVSRALVRFLNGLVEVNEVGQIKIDPWTNKTSVEGIWAAGDCTNILYHQNNIASGDAVKAIEDIYQHLNSK